MLPVVQLQPVQCLLTTFIEYSPDPPTGLHGKESDSHLVVVLNVSLNAVWTVGKMPGNAIIRASTGNWSQEYGQPSSADSP